MRGVPCDEWGHENDPKPTSLPFDGTQPRWPDKPPAPPPEDLPGAVEDGPADLPPLFDKAKPAARPKFEKFSWSNKTDEELRIYVPLDEADDVDAVNVDTAVKHVGTDHLGYRTSTNGDVVCTVTVHNWSHIELCIDVKFPHGTRKLEIPRLYAKAKYMGTIKKRKKLIFRLRKLDTWGVEWPGKVNHWPQIYWDTKFGKHVTG